MYECWLVTPSGNLTKALADNSQNADWSGIGASSTEPATTVLSGGTFATDTGVFNAGQGGVFAPMWLRILPYCFGLPGTGFSFRVFGWTPIGGPDIDVNKLVWVPYFLAEFACLACNQSGPAGAVRLVQPTENFCDTITLTSGDLGDGGRIYSPGTGTDLIGHIKLDTVGCRKFQFSFKVDDATSANALWANA